MYILSEAQRRTYAVNDSRDPGHESDYFWAWVEVTDPEEENEDHWLAMSRRNCTRNASVRGFLDHDGPKLLGADFVRLDYRGNRCEEGSSHVYTRADTKLKTRICVIRMNSSALVFPNRLKTLGITAQPGMLYLEIPYNYADVYEGRSSERCPPGGIFPKFGVFGYRTEGDNYTFEPAERPDDIHNIPVFGSTEFRYAQMGRHPGQQRQATSGKCFAFYRPETYAVIPSKMVPLYDLEQCYQAAAIPDVDLGEKVLIETPFVYAGGILWEMRAALRQSMSAVYGCNDGKALELVNSIFTGGNVPAVERTLREKSAATHHWNLVLPGFKVPERSPPDLAWMSSPKWETVQLLLLAYLSGGNAWQDALANLQVLADLEMPWSTR